MSANHHDIAKQNDYPEIERCHKSTAEDKGGDVESDDDELWGGDVLNS